MGRRKSAQSARTGAGKRGKSRAPKIAPASSSKIPAHAPPEWMVVQGGVDAVMYWQEVIVPRIKINALRDNEHQIAARCCIHFADWLDADRNMKRDGYTVDTPMTGGVGIMKRVNPEAKRRKDEEIHLLALEDRLGLNPMARYQLRNRAGFHPQSDFSLFSGAAQPSGAAGNTPRESHDDARDADPQSPPAAAPEQSPIGMLTH